MDVYAAGEPVRQLGIEDTLTGGNVLADYSLPVRELFAGFVD